jgi:hypothetical protein
MLLSYLGTRTQTPSSSPDLFSCYKMQRGLNEKTASVPNFLSQSRGSGQTCGNTLRTLSAAWETWVTLVMR